MATETYKWRNGQLPCLSAQNVVQNVLSRRDYVLRDGIDDVATEAAGMHFDKAVFYIHMSRGPSETLFRSVCDAVLGKAHTIAICIIDADRGSSQSLRHNLRQLAHRIDASQDGAFLPVIRVAASVGVTSPAPKEHLIIKETEGVLKSSGYLPFRIDGYFVLGAQEMLQAKILAALELIATFQKNARRPGSVYAIPRWPAILLD